MAGGIDWFRWHHGSVSDQKFVLVARRSGASVAEVIAVWACLLEQASTSSLRGCVGMPDFEAMDCALGMPDGRSGAVFAAMQDRKMIDPDGHIAAWEKRQPKRERDDDSSTNRVKAFRERKRQVTPCNADETPCNATDRQETPREEKRREDINNPPIVPPGDHKAGDDQPKPKRTKREAITLDAYRAGGGKLIRGEDDPVWEYCETIGLPHDLVRLAGHEFLARFSGTKKLQADWPAHFRNAIRANWFRLWFQSGDGWELTTAGHQAKRMQREAS